MLTSQPICAIALSTRMVPAHVCGIRSIIVNSIMQDYLGLYLSCWDRLTIKAGTPRIGTRIRAATRCKFFPCHALESWIAMPNDVLQGNRTDARRKNGFEPIPSSSGMEVSSCVMDSSTYDHCHSSGSFSSKSHVSPSLLPLFYESWQRVHKRK